MTIAFVQWSGLMQWQLYQNRRSGARHTLDVHPTRVFANDAVGERQPQPCSLAGLLGSEEGLEDSMANRLGHPGAMVGDRQSDSPAFQQLGIHHHDVPWMRSIASIGQQIDEHLNQLRAISFDLQARSAAVLAPDVLGFPPQLNERDRLRDRLVEGKVLTGSSEEPVPARLKRSKPRTIRSIRCACSRIRPSRARIASGSVSIARF